MPRLVFKGKFYICRNSGILLCFLCQDQQSLLTALMNQGKYFPKNGPEFYNKSNISAEGKISNPLFGG